MQEEPAFWMVYGNGQSAPTVKHKTLYDASREAERLARTVPGVQFYVLQAMAVAERRDVLFRRLAGNPYVNDDDLPF
jgi:hypothetical protein